jgi:hypothetical protein
MKLHIRPRSKRHELSKRISDVLTDLAKDAPQYYSPRRTNGVMVIPVTRMAELPDAAYAFKSMTHSDAEAVKHFMKFPVKPTILYRIEDLYFMRKGDVL